MENQRLQALRAGVLAGAWLALGAAHAAERVAASQPAASTAAESASAAQAPSVAHKTAPREPRGPKDPMEMLRDRLAQKLGARRDSPQDDPSVLRVVAKSGLPADTTASQPSATRSARHRGVAAVPAAGDGGHAEHAGPGAAAHWDYEGQGGPQAWGHMKDEFAKCSTGTRQSPIDIRDGIKVQLDPVQFDYKPTAFRVIDNGHTVQVNVDPGNFIEVMGRRYELIQFHFHRPSEERIDGRQFDMVVHLVHRDPEGRLAVVAVLLERGSAHAVVQNVWNNLPLEKGEELAARTPIALGDLLPDQRSYYTYMGSLTTPPCSEGVLWMVMKTPVAISAEQLAIFSRLYPMNARPVQSAAGRLIKESN